MGRFAGAHGAHGAVKIHAFTVEPTTLCAHVDFVDESMRPLCALRWFSRRRVNPLLATVERFQGAPIANREQAAQLRGVLLYLPRAALGTLDEDNYYFSDLIGLEVRDNTRQIVGTVLAVSEFGAQAVLEIGFKKTATRRNSVQSIGFTRHAVPEVNLKEGYLVIDPLFVV